MHRGHHGYPDLIDDHLTERSLGNVWSIPEPWGNTLKGSMMCKMVFDIFGIVKGLTGERWKSSAEIRKLFVRFRKEFRSNGELNNKVIGIN
jgi:hypothetical protein